MRQTSCVQGTVFLEPLDSLDPSLQIVESLVEVKKGDSTVVEIYNQYWETDTPT